MGDGDDFVEGVAGCAKGKGGVFVGDVADEVEAVEQAAAFGLGVGAVVGEGFGDEEVGYGEVVGAGATEASDVPVVVDGDVGGGDDGKDGPGFSGSQAVGLWRRRKPTGRGGCRWRRPSVRSNGSRLRRGWRFRRA